MSEDTKKKRGGARAGAGRRKLKPEAIADGDKNFASRVLARIGKEGWRNYADITKVTSPEDYALHLLATTAGYDQFNKLLDRRYGKPVQTVNHLHDKPIEMHHTFSLAERIKAGRERALKNG